MPSQSFGPLATKPFHLPLSSHPTAQLSSFCLICSLICNCILIVLFLSTFVLIVSWWKFWDCVCVHSYCFCTLLFCSLLICVTSSTLLPLCRLLSSQRSFVLRWESLIAFLLYRVTLLSFWCSSCFQKANFHAVYASWGYLQFYYW
jgi:hypothetical protein